MSIRRTAFLEKILVKCTKSFQEQGTQFNEGDIFELVLDMGSALVIKKPNDVEIIVSKQNFTTLDKAIEKS